VARGKKRNLEIEQQPDGNSPDALPAAAAPAVGEGSAPVAVSADHTGPEAHTGPEDEAGEKEAGEGAQQLPRCPSCGWRNVRLSHRNGILDGLMKVFSVAPFRCRSCGKRFHRRWVVREKKEE
jgi:hypothetical protein